MKNTLKFIRYFVCVWMLQSGLFDASAQSMKKIVKEAESSFEKGDFATAALYYRKALNKDSTVLDIDYKYAEASRSILDYAVAEKWYGFVYKQDKGKKFPLASFWFASMLKNTGKYKDAKQNFEK